MYFLQLMALLPIVLSIAVVVLFFILFNKMRKASIERNEVLKSILAELKSRKE
jgi:hypothetical protein